MADFALYTDSALTTPLTAALTAAQAADGSSAPVDLVVYLGCTDTAKKVQANSNPGVDQIVASVTDAASGSGSPAADIKLALTQGGLATATGGASLNLGTQVIGGSANAQAIWIRVTDSTHTVGTNTDLSVTISTLRQTAYP